MSGAVDSPPRIEPDIVAERTTLDGIALDLRITADLVPLAGHFPGVPIVPGVALIDWAVRLAARYVGFRDEGTSRLQIKFRRVLQPGCDVTLSIRRLSERNMRFEYRHLNTVYSSGTVVTSDT